MPAAGLSRTLTRTPSIRETMYKARALMQALGYGEEVVTACLA